MQLGSNYIAKITLVHFVDISGFLIAKMEHHNMVFCIFNLGQLQGKQILQYPLLN